MTAHVTAVQTSQSTGSGTDWLQIAIFITQTVTTLFIIATFIVYYRQLKTMQHQLDAARSAAQGQNLLSVLQYIQQERLGAARRTLVSLSEKPVSDWVADERTAANLACGAYDIAANLARRNIIPLEPLVAVWGYSIERCYAVAEPLIKEYRAPTGGRSDDYWDDFEWLRNQSAILRHNRRSSEN